MTRTILHRFTGAAIWTGEAETVRDAVHAALAAGADLSWANLSRADLSWANLSWANLSGANLSWADLSRANLSEANLSEANLSWANLSEADLSRANLSGANLSGANLSRANLSGANLSRANLSEANLSRANLSGANLSESVKAQFRDDLWAVLSASPAEVPGLLAAIREGRIDGSHYEGACACLVGTLANVRHCAHNAIPGLTPNASRLSEVWFMQIAPGQTPENHGPSKLAEAWVSDWLTRMQAAFGAKAGAQ